MKNPRVEEKLARIRAAAATSVELAGGKFNLLPSVYPSTELADLLVSCFDDVETGIKSGDTVLDYGTGCGYLAVEAAKRGARVVAIDINERAVECAKINSQLHNVSSHVESRASDCLSALQAHERFDWIVAGFPWDDSEPEDMLGFAMYDSGWRMRNALLKDCPNRLTSRGRVLLTYSETAECRRALRNSTPNLHFAVVRSKESKGEMHFVYLGVVKQYVIA